MTFYAHSLEGRPPSEWHKLEDHLYAVAEMARDFAEPFGGGEWAYLAGLWHDVGKYSREFQHMLLEANGIESHLETKPGKVIHSQAGGHLAQQKGWRGVDRVLSWLITGHHAGLADYATDKTGAKALEPKMRNPEISNDILRNVPGALTNLKEPTPPEPLKNGADVSFFIRMLFSCVVDADFLDTESFMDAEKAEVRQERYPTLEELLPAFDKYMDKLCTEAERTTVNRVRHDVLEQCRKMADTGTDVFSLTVPTGGGKTLSSLAFALRHAVKWEKRRIIYVIPYTSIIEQAARVFREIPGFEGAVLEHHCNVSQHDESRESVRGRLATENWDAPIIVTTGVQFFESLYASKTSHCRKLHNMADSVVIFDEAQCLPPEYLRPAVFAIRELHRYYGVTPVLCTATQPVLTKTAQFDFRFREGFEAVTEIVEDPDALSGVLKRVDLEIYADLKPVPYDQIADSMVREKKSVLCIVNRKSDCRIVAQRMPEEQALHLSTNMCAEHRFQVLEEIKRRLDSDNEPLFVISTSLVEAGVDLDFPVVYRALAGLDSIAQAAGRCNREGKLLGVGKTVVFLPEDQPDYVQQPASLAREHLDDDQLANIFLPETFNRYFKQRFFQLGEAALDEKGILKLLAGNLDFYFRTAAEHFKLIDDRWQHPLIVPFGEARELVDRLIDEKWNSRGLFRELQRFTISIPKRIHWKLMDEHHAHELSDYPGTYVLDTAGLYTERFGFVAPDEINGYDPEDLQA